MKNSLAHILVHSKPRENSGSRSSNRFDYQKSWALCKLLNLHISKEDYLIVFDYHEDIVVLNSEHEPTEAIFFQVKSRNPGHWTINLITTGKSSDLSSSILGKLYSNYKMCPEHTKSLVFVSNQGLSTTLADGKNALTLDLIKFSQLTGKDKAKIHESIEGNEVKFCDIAGLSLIEISRTELGIHDHVAFTKGKLVEFFEFIHPSKNIPVSLSYKTLFDEVKRRTNSEIICKSMSDLCKKKGIGREEFENIINLFVDYTGIDESWQEVNSHLISEKYNVSEIRGIKSSWRKYAIERMNISNEPMLNFRKHICDALTRFEASNPQYDLKTLIYSVKNFLNNAGVENPNNESFFTEAAIIYEAMTNDPIQKIDKKFKDEAV